MSDGKKGPTAADPFEAWRGMRDAYLDSWGKAMVEAVNSEAYAQATGTMLETYLTASSPFRDAVEKAMLKALEQMSMPTRADVVGLAERLTNIEMRLDDLDAAIHPLASLAERVERLESRFDEVLKKLDGIAMSSDTARAAAQAAQAAATEAASAATAAAQATPKVEVPAESLVESLTTTTPAKGVSRRARKN